MRPGPGLVVMALALIMGARRGGSSTSQQKQNDQHRNYINYILPKIYSNSFNINTDYNQIYYSHNKLIKIDQDEDTNLGEISALARINPWLSACDLAQPHQAPDLQGQCSTGALPVAWVDEGPGPPHCPLSCHQLRLQINKLINNNNNVNDKNYMKNNKLNNMYLKTNEKEYSWQQQDNDKGFNNKWNQQYQQKIINEQQQIKQQQQQLNQCLDYLGDNEESSPGQLCKKSSNEIVAKLRELRLKHCCERTVFSALQATALNATLNGGSNCIRILSDLIDLDTLATRITCELSEILARYDCRQVYSIINQCEDCKEAYRRWVCSTLIPYFAEPEDIRQNTTTSKSVNKSENHSAASSNLHIRSRKSIAISSMHKKSNYRNSKDVGIPSSSLPISTAIANPIVQDPLIERLAKKHKRKSEVKRRRRLRPCLSVCQTVEEKCPYMLPGDRAPAYPTQYAGEPTFLCLDPNIFETGEQLRKSNNGPNSCCYRYCGTAVDGICAHCELPTNLSNRTNIKTETAPNLPPIPVLTNNNNNNNNNNLLEFYSRNYVHIGNYYYYDDYDDLPPEQFATCSSLHGTTPNTQQRCTMPLYNRSSAISYKLYLKFYYLLIIFPLIFIYSRIFLILNWNNYLQSALWS